MSITFHGSNTDNINLKQWVAKLLHTINTWIERNPVFNGELTAITKGQLVYPSADQTVSLALTGGIGPSMDRWVGVVQKGIEPGELGVIKTAGYTLVMFKDGEIIGEGLSAYLSDEPGKATMVAGAGVPKIGIVGNASGYSLANPYAYVYLRSGCVLVQ